MTVEKNLKKDNNDGHGYPCRFCNSGRVAQYNAWFPEPRCQECFNNAAEEFLPSKDELEEQLNQPRYDPTFQQKNTGEPMDLAYDAIRKNLNRWFKEKWVDVSRTGKDGKHPPCGRSKANTSSKGYPKCRPSVKVSSKTPKTSGSMTSGQKRAATKRKRSKKQGVGGKPTIVKAMDDAWVFMKGRGDYPPCPTPNKGKYQTAQEARQVADYQSQQAGRPISTYPCVCGYHHLTRG